MKLLILIGALCVVTCIAFGVWYLGANLQLKQKGRRK